MYLIIYCIPPIWNILSSHLLVTGWRWDPIRSVWFSTTHCFLIRMRMVGFWLVQRVITRYDNAHTRMATRQSVSNYDTYMQALLIIWSITQYNTDMSKRRSYIVLSKREIRFATFILCSALSVVSYTCFV